MKPTKTILLSSLTTVAILLLAYIFFRFNQEIPGNQSKSINADYTTSEKSELRTVNLDRKLDALQQIDRSRRNIITETVAATSPAVVGINVTEVRQYRDPWSADPFFRHFFGDRVYKREVKSLGSGSIISDDGYIITNDHVAGTATKIIVTMTDGTEYDAKLIGSDPVSDIAVLKIDAENLPFIPMGDSDDLLIGEWVIALGNPFGLFAINDKPTVTVGVISAVGMNLGGVDERYYLNMIQTDAAINGGNSGGPLVNSLGELIGMNTLIYTAGGSSGNVGVGFAIPINKVKRIIDELKAKGSVDRDFWTGLIIQTIDEKIARYYELPSTKGVIITNIVRNSPADNAGLEVGDIILQVGKYKINDDNTMVGVLYEFRGGETVDLKILRNDNVTTRKLKLERRND